MQGDLSTITLVVNGLTLSLALGFLILLLWHDPSKERNQLFGVFVLFVIAWNLGSFLTQITLLSLDDALLRQFALTLMTIGFTGSSVSLYLFTLVSSGMQRRIFRVIGLASVVGIVLYQLFVIGSSEPEVLTQTGRSNLSVPAFQPLSVAYFLIFGAITLFAVWQYRRRMDSRGLSAGIVLYVGGQVLSLVNPELVVSTFATVFSSAGALVMGFAIIWREVLMPLSERNSQVEALHRVSMAITSRISVDTVLDELALQAAEWIDADAAGIFLRSEGVQILQLVSVYELPAQLRGMTTAIGVGVVGTTVAYGRTVFLEDYLRDWEGVDDLPLARQTFGSVICVPLEYDAEVIGALLVISGRHGRVFGREDARLLEMLGSQIAVVISHSQLFKQERALNRQLRAAHNQLRTVLDSTDNPVIAVDRQFGVMFANPAAGRLVNLLLIGERVEDVLQRIEQRFELPSLLTLQRAINRTGQYVFELSIKQTDFQCHIAQLGEQRTEGWVIVLNDVTQLKELDRLKSEMVRMASHDLKNPLMGAFAYLDLVNDAIDGLSVPGAEDVLSLTDTLEAQLKRMNRIIRGILDLERTSETRRREICRLVDLVEGMYDEMGQQAHDRAINLDVKVSDECGKVNVLVDREQFLRVLVNLVENAIKFSEEGKCVEVRSLCNEQNVTIVVQDWGVGIPPEIHHRVFDRFFRGKQGGMAHVSGTGLGLSLVKSVVENHDGRVWFESKPGEGSTFFVRIPKVLSSFV